MSSRGRVAYALLAPLAALGLWYHVVGVVGGAYLLLDVAASGTFVALAHAAGLALGAWACSGRLAARAGWVSAPALGAAHAVAGAAACASAPALFASRAAFAPAAYAFAVAFGLASGALARAFVRDVPALVPSPAVLPDVLRADVLALALAAALVGAWVAHRGGLVRTGLGLAVLACVASHLGATVAAAAPGRDAAGEGGAVASAFHRGGEAGREGAAARWRATARAAAGASYALCVAIALVEPLAPWAELGRAADPLVLARRGPWGRLLLTSGRGAFQLYVDASLRLSTIDAHRAREALAHPALAAAPRRARVLVVGGGDGTVAGEALRYDDVAEITVVEPDAELVALGRTQPVLVRENGGALDAPRVRVVHEDPMAWLARPGEPFDVALLDLGEPDAPARAKLYSAHFFGLVRARLAEGGVGATRTAPALAARRAHWCVVRTLEAAGLEALPYRAGLPAWGEQGYALFGRGRLGRPAGARLPRGLAWLDAASLDGLFDWPPDVAPVPVEVNRLYHQVLLKYREEAAL